MTVSTTTNKKVYAGLAAQDTFAYTFRVDDKADMEVYIDAVLQDPGDWTITGLGNAGGGDVILNTPLVADASVTLLRNVALTQGTDYQTGDAFPAESHEDALDRLTFIVQQLQEQLNRVPLLGVDSELEGFDLGLPVADEVVAYNATEDGLQATGIDYTSFNSNVAAAAASASAASTSETNAAASESAAAASAAAASDDADDAAAAAAAAGSYVAYGRVQSDGTVSKDNGLFTASNDGTGLIGITFDATQNDADYVILITSESSNARTALVVPASQDADGFQIEFENASGTANNSDCFVLCMRADAWLDA